MGGIYNFIFYRFDHELNSSYDSNLYSKNRAGVLICLGQIMLAFIIILLFLTGKFTLVVS